MIEIRDQPITETEAEEKAIRSLTRGYSPFDTPKYVIFEMYPDSLPDNWEQLLTEYSMSHNIGVFVSPLHTPDTDAKSHYHCMIENRAKMPLQAFNDDLSGVDGLLHCTKFYTCDNEYSYIKYTFHETFDSRNKQQFSEDEKDTIKVINQFPYHKLIKGTYNSNRAEKHDISAYVLRQLTFAVKGGTITSISSLIDWAVANLTEKESDIALATISTKVNFFSTLIIEIQGKPTKKAKKTNFDTNIDKELKMTSIKDIWHSYSKELINKYGKTKAYKLYCNATLGHDAYINECYESFNTYLIERNEI